MNTKRSTAKKTDNKSEKNAFWRKKSAIARKHMKRAKATGNGGWVKMLKKRISKYQSHISEHYTFDQVCNILLEQQPAQQTSQMSDEEVGRIMSAVNSLTSGGVAEPGTGYGNALKIAQAPTGRVGVSNDPTKVANVSADLQAKVREMTAKIPADKLAEYQKNPAKFGAINVDQIDISKHLPGPS